MKGNDFHVGLEVEVKTMDDNMWHFVIILQVYPDTDGDCFLIHLINSSGPAMTLSHSRLM